MLAAGSFALYWQLRERENDFVERRLQDETSKVDTVLRSRVAERVGSLARMAARWDAAGGTRRTPMARRRRQPRERALGPARAAVDRRRLPRALDRAAGRQRAGARARLARRPGARRARCATPPGRKDATLTPPLHLAQGYAGFIAYLPVRRDGRFDGFIAGVFSIDEFFHGAISDELSRNYTMSILHEGTVYFTNTPRRQRAGAHRDHERIMRIGDRALDAAHGAHAGLRGSAEIRAAARWCSAPACWWRRWRRCRCASC